MKQWNIPNFHSPYFRATWEHAADEIQAEKKKHDVWRCTGPEPSGIPQIFFTFKCGLSCFFRNLEAPPLYVWKQSLRPFYSDVIKVLRITQINTNSRNLIIFGGLDFLFSVWPYCALWSCKHPTPFPIFPVYNPMKGHGPLRSNSSLLSPFVYSEWKLAFRLLEAMTRHWTGFHFITYYSRNLE